MFGAFLLFFNGGFFCIFHFFIQHCFTCRPSDSTVSTTALAVRRSNQSARSGPQIILLFVLFRVLEIRTCSDRKLYCGEIIPVPLYWRTEAFLRKWRCRSNSPRKLWTRFEFADFFHVRAASFYAPNIRCANKLARYK